MDCSIQILDFVLNEQRHFDMFVLVKFGKLLFNYLKVVAIKLVDQKNKFGFAFPKVTEP